MAGGHDAIDLSSLSARLGAPRSLRGDAGWDAARQAWNLAADQRPAAIVLAAACR